jgi:hypothetical protein
MAFAGPASGHVPRIIAFPFWHDVALAGGFVLLPLIGIAPHPPYMTLCT